jgi:menaquinone-dependent protoporphyrinogen oxidase
MRRILVAYATKLDSTREIAERIGDELRAAGHQVDVRAAGDVREPIQHDAVILGSAL